MAEEEISYEPSKRRELKEVANNLTDEQLVRYLADAFKGIDKDGTRVISLVAAPASGKGTLAAQLVEALGSAATLSTDNYLKGTRPWRQQVEDQGLPPDAKYDFEFLREQVEAIKALKDGEQVGIPIYDGQARMAVGPDPDHRPDPNTYPTKVGKVDYLIIEGDFQPLDRAAIDKLVYLDVPDDVRLANRINRDLQERSETAEQAIIDNFNQRQQSQFYSITLPNRDRADTVIKVDAKELAEPTPKRKFAYTYKVLEAAESA